MTQRVLSAKLPERLIADLDVHARRQGISRNRLVRLALEGMLDGRCREPSLSEEFARRYVEREEEDRRRLRTLVHGVAPEPLESVNR